MANEIKCRTCHVAQPLSAFSPNKKMKLGVRNTCKKCCSDQANQWRRENRDKVLDSHLRRNFGITLDQYEGMLQSQGGVCAICHRPGAEVAEQRSRSGGVIARLYVDHDHATGEVRGLLCHPCNVAIGMLQDDPEIITSAAEYIKKARG